MEVVLLYDSYNFRDNEIYHAITNFEKCQGMIGIKTNSIKKMPILMNQPPVSFRN